MMRPMRSVFSGIFSLSLLALAAGGSEAAISNGPYYAEPAWDQKLPAATRFVVLTDWNSAAVPDRETGLVWEQAPATNILPWGDSIRQCDNKNVGGRKGWRLPSVAELTSLVDPSIPLPGPPLPAGHPFSNIQPGFYWSATSDYINPTNARMVVMTDGKVENDLKDSRWFTWCVRGGMNAYAH